MIQSWISAGLVHCSSMTVAQLMGVPLVSISQHVACPMANDSSIHVTDTSNRLSYKDGVTPQGPRHNRALQDGETVSRFCGDINALDTNARDPQWRNGDLLTALDCKGLEGWIPAWLLLMPCGYTAAPKRWYSPTVYCEPDMVIRHDSTNLEQAVDWLSSLMRIQARKLLQDCLWILACHAQTVLHILRTLG